MQELIPFRENTSVMDLSDQSPADIHAVHLMQTGFALRADILKSIRYLGPRADKLASGWKVNGHNELVFPGGSQYLLKIEPEQTPTSVAIGQIFQLIKDINPGLAQKVLVLIASKCALTQSEKGGVQIRTDEIFNSALNSQNIIDIEQILYLLSGLHYVQQSDWIPTPTGELASIRKYLRLFNVSKEYDVLKKKSAKSKEKISHIIYNVKVENLGLKLFANESLLNTLPLDDFNAEYRRNRAENWVTQIKVLTKDYYHIKEIGSIDKTLTGFEITLSFSSFFDQLGLIPSEHAQKKERYWISRNFKMLNPAFVELKKDDIFSDFFDFERRLTGKYKDRILNSSFKIHVPSDYYCLPTEILKTITCNAKETSITQNLVEQVLSQRAISQAELSRILNVSKTTITNYIKNRRQAPAEIISTLQNLLQ